MIIFVKQSKTGLYLAANGSWVSKKSEAMVFKHAREAMALMPKLTGPLDLYYNLGDRGVTVPLTRLIDGDEDGIKRCQIEGKPIVGKRDPDVPEE